jgi:hypothetical protein
VTPSLPYRNWVHRQYSDQPVAHHIAPAPMLEHGDWAVIIGLIVAR